MRLDDDSRKVDNIKAKSTFHERANLPFISVPLPLLLRLQRLQVVDYSDGAPDRLRWWRKAFRVGSAGTLENLTFNLWLMWRWRRWFAWRRRDVRVQHGCGRGGWDCWADDAQCLGRWGGVEGAGEGLSDWGGGDLMKWIDASTSIQHRFGGLGTHCSAPAIRFPLQLNWRTENAYSCAPIEGLLANPIVEAEICAPICIIGWRFLGVIEEVKTQLLGKQKNDETKPRASAFEI